jgi:hypothetical protein
MAAAIPSREKYMLSNCLRISLPLLLSWCLAGGAAAQATPAKKAADGTAPIAGKVVFAEGSASLVSGKGSPRPAKAGERVFEGDRLLTGDNGEIHVAMEDGGLLALRPETEVKVERFRARGKVDDISLIGLAKGALRSVTGWIGKVNPRGVEIRAPQATIGIRGTDHETVVVPVGSKKAEPGTYDKVNAGGTTLATQAGAVDIGAGQAAHAAPGGRSAPRLLEAVPAVFQPTRNEGRLNGVHDAIQPKLEGWRQERQQRPDAPLSQIRGNTRIEARNQNAAAVAVGSKNRAANQAGVIGGE